MPTFQCMNRNFYFETLSAFHGTNEREGRFTSDPIHHDSLYVCAAELNCSSWATDKAAVFFFFWFFFGAAYGTKCYLQRIISILKKKKGSLNCNRLRLLSQWRDGVATYLFLPESRNPLANGLRSIFSLVICRQGEHEKDMFVIRAA